MPVWDWITVLRVLACLTSANQPSDVCLHPRPDPVCLYPSGGSVHACVTLSVSFPETDFLSPLKHTIHHFPSRTSCPWILSSPPLTSIWDKMSSSLFKSGQLVSETRGSGATAVRRLFLASATGESDISSNSVVDTVRKMADSHPQVSLPSQFLMRAHWEQLEQRLRQSALPCLGPAGWSSWKLNSASVSSHPATWWEGSFRL